MTVGGDAAETVETARPATGPAGTAAGGAADPALAEEVATAYADGVFASYDASLTSATAMQEAIQAFIADPTDDTLAGGQGGVADRPRRLRPDRGLPLLRRSHRQP